MGLQPIATEELSRRRSTGGGTGEDKERGLYQLDYLAGLEEVEIADRIWAGRKKRIRQMEKDEEEKERNQEEF